MEKNIIPPKSRKDIERDACFLLQNYQPGVLLGKEAFDVEAFAEHDLEDLTKISFSVTDDLPLGVLGLTDPIQKELWMPTFLAENESEPGRRRYRSTLAHEVGHCYYHADLINRAGQKQVFSQRKYEGFYRVSPDVKAYLDPEWQAWWFAGAIMMPQTVVTEMNRQGATTQDLIDHFDLNRAFVEWRLRKLGLK